MKTWVQTALTWPGLRDFRREDENMERFVDPSLRVAWGRQKKLLCLGCYHGPANFRKHVYCHIITLIIFFFFWIRLNGGKHFVDSTWHFVDSTWQLVLVSSHCPVCRPRHSLIHRPIGLGRHSLDTNMICTFIFCPLFHYFCVQQLNILTKVLINMRCMWTSHNIRSISSIGITLC